MQLMLSDNKAWCTLGDDTIVRNNKHKIALGSTEQQWWWWWWWWWVYRLYIINFNKKKNIII